MHADLSAKLSGGDYDLALALFVENFFTNFEKDSNEQELWENFRDFLSLDLVLKAEATSEGVSLNGRYDYKEGVLNSDYGLRVAAKLTGFGKVNFPMLSMESMVNLRKSFFSVLIFKRSREPWSESIWLNHQASMLLIRLM